MASIRQYCPNCKKSIIPLRLIGKYVSDRPDVKLWNCSECSYFWTNAH